jgi:hypothetical protein
VLAAEHLLDFAGIDQAREFVDAGRQLGRHVFALACPFDEHTKIFSAFAERADQLDFLLDSPAALEKLLRLGLVGPEIGSRRARFYFCKLFGWTSGFKDSSEGRTRA